MMAGIRFDAQKHAELADQIVATGQHCRLAIDFLDDYLLVLRIEPFADFIHLVADWEACMQAYGPYHVSIAETTICTDIDIQKLRDNFDGLECILGISYVSQTSGYMELSSADVVTSNSLVQKLHANGCYSDRKLHISG